MKIMLRFFIPSLLFVTHTLFTMRTRDQRRHSAPVQRRKYQHSPGTYRREFSPRGTTLYLIKEEHPEKEPIILKLTKNNQSLKQHTKEPNDTNDQDTKKLCNKE